MATILALPQEVLVRVFDHVEKKDLPSIRIVCSDFEMAGNPRFAKEFLTRRRLTMSLESISTMHEIVSHPYFGPFVRTIIFNCLRTADPHTPIDHDSVISSLPFQVDAEETIEETSAKYLKVVQIVQTIKKNHGRISIGVCLENAHKIQSCYGLGQLVSKGNLWPVKRMVYSVNHMKHNLKALLHISKQADCPVSSIGVDLGSHTSECYDQVTPWFFGPTIYQAIKGVYNEPVKISLNLKYGVDDSRRQTIFYDMAHGDTIAIANQHLPEVSVGLTEETLRSRKHSTLLHSVLDNLSNETSLLFTQARSRYVLEEVQGVGDTDDWAKDLCTRINTISVSEEQEKPTTAVQSGSIMFMGAVRTEGAETDDWADEIGWDLDQVLKKHQEKA
ncbi:hypothetical protein D6C84_09856 [Aureobasidium pullulans]|uniref:F-box domain-containing protein n=1 Tax=Aureobasidium pullulans TaxID=5580 RepID=A0A4S9X4Y6_AURPU|nr:hypothetical protein D6C84_09856 [Aureobasidium pullulans]